MEHVPDHIAHQSARKIVAVLAVLLSDPALDDLVQTVKCAAADKEDVRRIDLDKFLMRMLSSALRGDRSNGPLKDLEQGLLNALAGYIPRNRNILRLLGDLIYLIDIDNTLLRPRDIVIRSLYQLEQDILNILADIACLCKRSRVRYGKGNIEHPCQGLGQKSLAGTRRAGHDDVALLQLHIGYITGCDPLIMIVYSYGEDLLGLLLADDIIIEKCLDLSGLHEIDVTAVLLISQFIFYDLRTDAHTAVADIRVRACDQLADLRLRFPAE